MKKYRMTQLREETSKQPLPENVVELIKLATFAMYEADKRGIPRNKIDAEKLLRVMRKRKPDEYRYEIGEV